MPVGGLTLPSALPPSLAYKPDLPGDIAVVRRFRNHLLADPYRPVYHFVIPEDYAGPFDPNGALYHHVNSAPPDPTGAGSRKICRAPNTSFPPTLRPG